MKDFNFLQGKYLVSTYPNRGLTIVRGNGMYLYDQNGTKYLDVMSNMGVNILGYNHPEIVKSLTNQLKQLTTLHCSFTSDVRAEASQEIVKKCAEGYSRVYWANSGTEGIEAALKFAVAVSGKKHFISMQGGYHGKTLGALSATYDKKYRGLFEPLLWHFTHVEYGHSEKIEDAVTDKTAAVILEPIQGETGIIVPPAGYLKSVRRVCEKKGILLILDEVQSGMGRTGKFLASQHENISADILCLGKGLAGGIPVGATVVSEKVAVKIPKGIHTSTFGGNPLALRGVITVLKLLDDKMLSHVQKTGDYFISRLKEIKSENILEVRGKGLMIAVEVKENRNLILKKLQEKKILAIPAGDDAVRFLAPFIISKKEVDWVVSTLAEVLKELEK